MHAPVTRQCLTLGHAVVHCSKEFVPGLIYIAISRVRHPDDIEVCKFKRDQLLKPPDESIHVCQHTQEECPDLTCCVNQNLNSDLFEVSDIREEFGEENGDAPESLPVDSYLNGLVASYFKKEDDKISVDLGAVFLDLEESENELSRPPDDFDTCQVMQSCRVYRPSNSVLQRIPLSLKFRLTVFHS